MIHKNVPPTGGKKLFIEVMSCGGDPRSCNLSGPVPHMATMMLRCAWYARPDREHVVDALALVSFGGEQKGVGGVGVGGVRAKG